MNWINSLIGVLILALMVVIGYKVGQLVIELNAPAIPVVNTSKFTLPIEPVTNLTLRWNHFPLTVYIDDSFVKQRPEYVDNFRQALEIWQSSTNNLITFLVVTDSTADITLEWLPSLRERATDTLGNTDLKFINISEFGVIQNAKIELLTKSDSKQLSGTDMTNLALHEIGHAIGLSHSNQESDIMYPSLTIPSSTIKTISSTEIQNLQDIYKIPAKPDLRIAEANVTKVVIKRFGTTYYLANISMMIENVGLIDAEDPILAINVDGTTRKEGLTTIPVGNRLSIILGNLRVDSDYSTVELILDPVNSIDELNEGNNVAKLAVT